MALTKSATSQHPNPLAAARERIFLRLGDSGAVGADGLQWILYRRASRKIPRAPWQGLDWSPISFVRSAKGILERCIREKGLDLSAESRAALDNLPATFDEWKEFQSGPWKAWLSPLEVWRRAMSG